MADTDPAGRRYQLCEQANKLYDHKRYREALDAYLSVAALGADQDRSAAEVLLRIGSMYYRGLGTAANPVEAERWIARAAALGLPAALYSLAVMRSHDERYDETKALLERAAAQHYSPAIYRLGVMYDLGLTVPRDTRKASELYQTAAAAGHILAARQVALALLRGQQGLLAVPAGLFRLVKGFFKLLWLYASDPTDERIQV